MASTSKSGESKVFCCEYCKKEFNCKYKFNRHRKIHLMKSDFKCSFCDYVTNFKTDLFHHIRTHTKERLYKCEWPNCTADFSYPAGRDRHIDAAHKKDDESVKKHKCPKCPYKTVDKSTLSKHLTTHSDLKEFFCDLCSYRAHEIKNVKRHHESVHLKLKPFKCPHQNCYSAFSRKYVLNQHQLVHNKDDESLLKFKCPECDYKTGRQGDLNEHLVVHSEVKPFACDLCPFRSKHKKSVKQHFKCVHSKLQQFYCPEPNCSYSGKTKTHLSSHLKVHGDYKKFACAFPPCTHKAKHKSAIKNHEMTHHGEKPLKCNFCSFKCVQRSNLSAHFRIHTGETPYSCSKCPYRGKSYGNLKVHVQKHYVGK